MFRGRRKAAGAAKKAGTDPGFPTVVTVSLVYTSGLVFPPERWTDEAGLGTLNLVVWARLIRYLDSVGGRMVVVERDPRQEAESTHEFALARAEVEEVLRLLEASGLPNEEPGIEPLLDSSDRWAHMTLNVSTLKGRRSMDVDMNTSSYEGEGAPALRAFLHELLRVAGAGDPNVWYDLTGHWRAKQ